MVEASARLSRRQLFKAGLSGAALVTVGGAVLFARDTVLRQEPPEDLVVLSAEEYAILAAVAARICPALGEGAPGADALEIAKKADRMLASLSKDVQRGMKIALFAIENALLGALVGERIAPFTQLTPEAQDRVLDNMRRSRLTVRRTLYRALSSLVSALYWGDERAWARIGYPGPPDPVGLRQTYADNLVDLSALRKPPTNGP